MKENKKRESESECEDENKSFYTDTHSYVCTQLAYEKRAEHGNRESEMRLLAQIEAAFVLEKILEKGK